MEFLTEASDWIFVQTSSPPPVRYLSPPARANLANSVLVRGVRVLRFGVKELVASRL